MNISNDKTGYRLYDHLGRRFPFTREHPPIGWNNVNMWRQTRSDDLRRLGYTEDEITEIVGARADLSDVAESKKVIHASR